MRCSGGAALDLKSVAPKPFRWMTDTTWLNLVQLSNLKHFASIVGQVWEGSSILVIVIYYFF